MANPRRKVYWKQLVMLLERANKYIGKYDTKLDENLTAPQYDAVVALGEQLTETINLLPQNEPE